ncbi:MAG TPA: sigma-70 family RNA polymerase sigma factor [Trebonia sp.]|jgi:RNA polymerase sigma factor (sigma-70 family)
MRDSELAALIVDGDPDAIAEAYDRYADLLWSYCRSLLSDSADASDAVLDTFVIAASRLEVLRPLGRLRAWLYAVARSECQRRLRSRKVSPSATGTPRLRRAAEALSTGEQRELRALLSAAFGGLEDAERDVMNMVWHGLDLAEVAVVLGTSRSEAYTLFTRARDQLETSVGVLLVGWSGRVHCQELDGMLTGRDRQLTPDLRGRLSRHIDKCDVCVRRYRQQMRPALLLGLSVGALLSESAEARAVARPAPAGLWEEVYQATSNQNPDAIWHRIIGSRRVSFGDDGFPQVLARNESLTRTPKFAAVATVGTLAVAGTAGGVAVAAHHVPVSSVSAASSGNAVKMVAPDASAATAPGASHAASQQPKGKHAKPDTSAKAKAGTSSPSASPSALPTTGSSAVTVAGGTGPSGGSPSSSGFASTSPSGSPAASSPTSGSTSSGSGSSSGSTSSSPSPAATAGTLSVSTTNIAIAGTGNSSFTLTAEGGSVNWSIAVPSGLLGSVSLSATAGTLAAGQSVTITVTGKGLAAIDTPLTISPGGQTVTVDVSLL